MGFGDEIMVTGQVRRMQQADKRRVKILDRNGQPRWNVIWNGNPKMARPSEQGDFQLLTNAPGDRPYIAAKSDERWFWKPFECTPGEIYLSDAERQFARPYVPQIVIEPTIKQRASPNKQWGMERWEKFAHMATKAGFHLVQMGPHGMRPLKHAELIPTPDFRHACAVLANADAYVGHEGGLHHAAAALDIPAVVIFGGFISPAQTGYASHKNLYAGGEPCGMRIPCKHCDESMQSITPQIVLNSLMEILNAK
jgi:ADP-heptose:LPS heptosyltransferase